VIGFTGRGPDTTLSVTLTNLGFDRILDTALIKS
jgi:hypothetical protein